MRRIVSSFLFGLALSAITNLVYVAYVFVRGRRLLEERGIVAVSYSTAGFLIYTIAGGILFGSVVLWCRRLFRGQ